MSDRLCTVGHLCNLSVSRWGCKNMATQEAEVSLQGKRETFPGYKTLEMGSLNRLLNSFHLLEEMTQEQHILSILLGYHR